MIVKDIAQYEESDSELAKYTIAELEAEINELNDSVTWWQNRFNSEHKEVKRLKEEYMMLQNASDKVEEEKDREIERLHSIIKEVREYINSIGWNTTIPNIQDNVWRILDKENNNEGNNFIK